MKPRLPHTAIVCVLAFMTRPALAQSFSEAFGQALKSEPEFLQAHANLAVSQARINQAVAATLPQLKASASTQGNRRDYETLNSPLAPSLDNYRTTSTQLNLNQQLWRPANDAAIEQSNSALNQSKAQLQQAEQALFTRLATAWFDTLAARDAVVFAEQQTLALARQVSALERGVALGYRDEATLEETRARQRLAAGDLFAARNELQMKLTALEFVTGAPRTQPLPRMSALPEGFTLHPDWAVAQLRVLTDTSPAVIAAGFGIEAAQAEVKKQRAGHLPTVDVVGTVARNRNPAGNRPVESGYDSTTSSLGFEISVPIYSGGGQDAKVSEALALKERARLEQEVARRSTYLALQQAMLGWHTARTRTESTHNAVKAAQRVLTAAQAGEIQGTKTDVDVLQAQTTVAGYERDYHKSLYEQVTSYLKLKAALGQLTLEDARLLDDAMKAGPAPQDQSAAAPGASS